MPMPAALCAAVPAPGHAAASVTPATPPCACHLALQQDHRSTLTLFAHFFKAAAAAEAATAAGSEASAERLMLKISAGALALDFHLHAKARWGQEMAALDRVQ